MLILNSFLQGYYKNKITKGRAELKGPSRNVSSGFLLPKMRADVLLQHAAESRPQVVKSPVKRVDAMTQHMAAKRTYLGKKDLL